MKTKEEDFVEHLFVASSKDTMLFFTDTGRVYQRRSTRFRKGAAPRAARRSSTC